MHLASHSGKAFAKPQIISRVVLWWLTLRPIPVPAILDVHHKDRVVMNDPHARLQAQVVHATDEFAPHAPPSIPVLPEWSPVKVFGGYGAPLDVRKAARAGVPITHQHDCTHAVHQLLAGIEAARNRYAGFFGLGCDCFAF